MPTSVLVAAAALSLMLASRATMAGFALIAGTLTGSPGHLVQFAVSMVLGGLILWGLVVGHRLAWQWGRLATVLGIIVFSLTLFAFFRVPMTPANILVLVLLVGQIVPLLVVFFALGTPSARSFFKLECPQCRKFTSRAADFLFTRAKCGECGTVW